MSIFAHHIDTTWSILGKASLTRMQVWGALIGNLGLIDHVWPHFFDGCSITRPTDEWLLQAGEWESVDLKPGDDETKFDVIPHAIGTLVKKR